MVNTKKLLNMTGAVLIGSYPTLTIIIYKQSIWTIISDRLPKSPDPALTLVRNAGEYNNLTQIPSHPPIIPHNKDNSHCIISKAGAGGMNGRAGFAKPWSIPYHIKRQTLLNSVIEPILED